MGKKNKKFKKHTYKHSSQNTENRIKNTVSAQPQANENADVKEIAAPAKSEPAISVDEMRVLNERYTYVRRDVRKLVIAMTTLVVLFVVIYYLNTKSDTLVNFGDWLYKIGHFSI